MRVVSAPELAILNGSALNIHAKLEIKNASGTWKDIGALGGKDYFVGIRLSTDVDTPVWSMQATVKRDGEVSTESLSPLRGDSTLNVDDALLPAPMINAAREWRVSVAVVAAGAALISGDWKELAHGYVDRPDFTNDPMQLEGRSVGARLMDSTIRVKRTYSGAFETVAQQIVTDNLPSPAPTLYIPSPPAFTVTEFTPFQVSVMDALVTLALSTGWMVRDVYDPADNVMKTGIIDPQRAKPAEDATLIPSVYLAVDQASLDVANVRNVIEGEYIDAVTGEIGSITVTDPASIAAFGGVERYMKFSEDATSPINTGNEMLAMVQAALADLSTPKFDHTVTSTLFWPAEITDLYDFTGNAVHYDTTQRLAVFGIVHDLSTPGHGTTQFACRGTPAGAYFEWIRRQGPGPTGPLIPPAPVLEFLLAEGTQYGGTSATVDGALWVGFRFPKGSVDEIRIHQLLGDGPNLGVPNLDATTLGPIIRRPDGDIGKTDEYASIAIDSTDEGFWKRIMMIGVRGGLTSKPVIPAAVQAVDPAALPIDGEVDAISVVRSGSTNTVTVTPGLTEPVLGVNYLCIVRNKEILPPIAIGTSTADVVFADSGLEPSRAAAYMYEAFIANVGATWFVSGGKRSTVVEGPSDEPPIFVNGSPILAVVGGQQVVEIDWTGATVGATTVRVDASLDGASTRVVGTGALASGTVYDPQVGPKLYRLVALDAFAAVVVAGPWKWYPGTTTPPSNPGGVPEFQAGTPKVVLTGSGTPLDVSSGGVSRVQVVWTCTTPLAATVTVQRSTAGSGGPFTNLFVSGQVANGMWTAPNDTYNTVDAYYRLEAKSSGGTSLAVSAVKHFVPLA